VCVRACACVYGSIKNVTDGHIRHLAFDEL
jgi:hypothetical protein